MPLLTSLLILIVVARLLGSLFERMNQPAIVGEILAGILLGPTVLDFIHGNPALLGISELAIFLVILSAGLEMSFRDVIDVFRGRGVVVAVLGFSIPFLAGILIGVFFGLDVMRTIFLGLIFSITALPVSIRIFSSFGMLNSNIAKYTVTSAILSDVLALLILGVILGVPAQGSFGTVMVSIVQTGGKLILLALVFVILIKAIQKLQDKGLRIYKIPEKLINIFGSEALFGIVVAFVLVFGSISDFLGFHFVIGAFFAALLIDRKFFLSSRYSELESTVNSVTEGFLAPIFFAYIGLEFSVDAIESVSFLVVIVVASLVVKTFAGWLGGKLIGLSGSEATGVGISLNFRGAMDLVVASIAFDRGFIDQGMFSALVVLAVLSTLVTPAIFKTVVIRNQKLPAS